jgi:hypothetical protein
MESMSLSIYCDGPDNKYCSETFRLDVTQRIIDIESVKSYVADCFGWSFEDGVTLCKTCTSIKENANA